MINDDAIRRQSSVSPIVRAQPNKSEHTEQVESRPAIETDPVMRNDLSAIRVWIMAGGSLCVALVVGMQVYQLLGSLLPALIATLSAFLMVFCALVIVLGAV